MSSVVVQFECVETRARRGAVEAADAVLNSSQFNIVFRGINDRDAWFHGSAFLGRGLVAGAGEEKNCENKCKNCFFMVLCFLMVLSTHYSTAYFPRRQLPER
jgi:hypothetical protein